MPTRTMYSAVRVGDRMGSDDGKSIAAFDDHERHDRPSQRRAARRPAGHARALQPHGAGGEQRGIHRADVVRLAVQPQQQQEDEQRTPSPRRGRARSGAQKRAPRRRRGRAAKSPHPTMNGCASTKRQPAHVRELADAASVVHLLPPRESRRAICPTMLGLPMAKAMAAATQGHGRGQPAPERA